jgi:hypothetical protein
MKSFLCIALALCSIIEAAVISPSGSTVWTNGASVQIQWNSISGNEVTIVLTRSNTIYHHTIVSYAPNSGTFTWQVNIPGQDGWPSSTSSERVYEIDFYINGGWNNGGTLVAQSQQFAIQWSGSGIAPPVTTVTLVTNPPPPASTITIITNSPTPGFYTTTRTEVIVGVTTLTTVITAVYEVGSPSSTSTVIVQTLTSTQQVQTTTRTTIVGATTIGTTQSPQVQQLINSGTKNFGNPVMFNILGIIIGVRLIFG